MKRQPDKSTTRATFVQTVRDPRQSDLRCPINLHRTVMSAGEFDHLAPNRPVLIYWFNPE